MTDSSPEYQTGSVVILAISIVCCGAAIAFVIPLLKQASSTGLPNSTTAVVTQRSYDEFYPTIQQAERQLTRAQQNGPIRVAATPQNQVEQVASGPNPFETFTAANPAAIGLQPPTESTAPAAEQPALDNSQDMSEQLASSPSPSTEAPRVYTPTEIPHGTVYAPVTVHLDTSAIAEQISKLGDRLPPLPVVPPAAIVQNDPPPAKKPRTIRKPRRRKREAETSEVESRLTELSQKVDLLKLQTEDGIRRVELQANRTEVATQVIESYRRALQDAEAQATEKAQTRVALDDTAGRFDVPILPPAATKNPVTEPTETQETDAVPLPREVGLKIFTPTAEVVPDESSVETNSESPVVAPGTKDTPAIELPPAEADVDAVQEDEELDLPELFLPPLSQPSSGEKASSRSNDIIPTGNQVLPPIERHLVEPPEMTLPEPKRSFSEASPPILKSSATTLRPVPEEPRVVQPVAFENTFRFTMTVDEKGQGKVVRTDNAYCEKCGRVHAVGNHTAAAKNKNTSSTATRKWSTQPQRLRGNAGRGLKMKLSSHEETDSASSADSQPLIKWPVSSQNDNTEEPSVIHRVTSTIRQLGRDAR